MLSTMVSDHSEVDDLLSASLRKEKTPAYQLRDYLGVTSPDTRRPQVDPKPYFWAMTAQSRWQIGQWFHQMVEDFNFPEEFATVAMNYFDRVLARSQSLPNTKQEVQLLALTCFYLAVKMHQAGPILSTQQMSMISGSEFSVKSVADMEQHVLLTLNWSLYPPCALEFVRPFLSILLKQNCIPSSVCHFEVVNEALDTLNAALLQDYFFIAHDLLPSHLALAALLVAVRAVHPYAFAIPSVQDAARIISSESGTQMSEEQVTLCYTRLWTIHDTERDRCWSNPTVACVPAGVPTCLSDHNRSTPVSPVGVTLGTFKAVKQFEIYVPSL